MCKNDLKRKQEKGDLVVMDFPSQTRDLNPTENLWDHLKREKVKHDPTSKDNLWDVLNQCWNNLKPAVLRILVELCQEELKPYFKSKGGHTK
jgi:curved DNA-binding protein CbpA